jgi:glycerol-3-phosphate acyltransferase PlsY
VAALAPILALLFGYLVGSFPTGYLAARFLGGVDVRTVGSGRTGGTNVLRSAGRTAAIITIVGDTIKGIVAVYLARVIWAAEPDIALIASLTALGIVLGHNYSIFLGFKGGAGTMTGGGALMALDPAILLASAIIPIIFAYITRMSSIGSLLFSGIGFLIGLILVYYNAIPTAYLIYLGGFCLISWYAHRPNIERLRAGTERRIGDKAKA